MLRKCDFIGIIPSRFGSTRFPGKPLALIDGVSMIERVYRQASLALDRVLVATDDERIRKAVEQFDGEVVMTSPDCQNGTQRVAEAFRKVGSYEKVVINIQGDEPFIHPGQIEGVMKLFMEKPDVKIGTLAYQFDPAEGFEALFNPNRVKMTMDDSGRVLYFSRSIIPYVRNYKWQEWLYHATFYTHIGLYGFRAEVLEEIVGLNREYAEKSLKAAGTLQVEKSLVDKSIMTGKSSAEKKSLAEIESLEQLEWLQKGYPIYAVVTRHPSHPIDTPEDLERISKKNEV
ncbi:MAG: 3-deoxy-manno-octulosonate cytidylyltransferase [Duncaniella sp.]|nr:3-deoxy-manno-octulosonate cytidylyltransferase [Duncaniella sp.]